MPSSFTKNRTRRTFVQNVRCRLLQRLNMSLVDYYLPPVDSPRPAPALKRIKISARRNRENFARLVCTHMIGSEISLSARCVAIKLH